MSTLERHVAVEIAVQDLDGVRVAIKEGAERIELCQALGVGGLTPSIGLVMAAVRAADEAGLTNFVHVLVRPREGGFVYSPGEVEVMLGDVLALEAAGAAGVVVGALQGDRSIDLETTARFVESAGDLEVTFHRAFDASLKPLEGIDALAEAGVRRVLTSGQARSSIDGVPMLSKLVEHAAGRVEIMAGGGVTVDAIPELVGSGVDAVHLSAKRPSGRLTETGPGGGSAAYDVTDATTVARAVAAVRRSIRS
ncbi:MULTISPECIES: copper homeostasis protein CutC [unclassified Plantibacter]|jgi:copper homeostasis protein|uniref:copper homeostasis protein CutC n=1 Tax=unclassified Plantibacter TaxID=2624265 RepID=UPI003D330E84